MKRFPAKILLFGEYGLLYGAKALALPFPAFGGQLRVNGVMPSTDTKEHGSFLEIDRFISFFEYHDLNKEMNYPIDLHVVKEDLKKGLYFKSDIPLGYGVGSSGALCAAIFDEYSVYHQQFNKFSRNRDILESLKNDFSVMERYFHGSSSGIDPLVSFLNRPVVYNNGHSSIVDFSEPEDYSIFLIDTKLKSHTAPLVEGFKRRMKDSAFSELFKKEYLPFNDGAIESVLASNPKQLFLNLKKIIPFQLKHFSAMIPTEFKGQIQKFIDEKVYIKLLGSGGGGFLLAFIPNGIKLKTSSPTLEYKTKNGSTLN